jgi:class 3 adenylate cyclase/tetratricopeptide (TPR) repeat protein
VRKTVTVLFCDVVGSTALGERIDPEPYRVLLARYFEEMKGIVESHGGTIDKFIGDAVEAVFGIPQAHEDDALRACRAAVEMREVLPALGLQARIGIQTGEVVAGTAERLVTGDAVNVAARFEQTAQPGEVLIGNPTYALVRDAVIVEPVEPLELKGKSEPVPAFRLLSVLDAPERSHASRFVGRARELGMIFEAWERAQGESRCELVTIVGEAGVGKSRLVTEALGPIGARVVRGRCLPYGDGITYWPVVEVIKQLAVLPSDPIAAGSIRSLLRESEFGTSSDEIAWAFRKLLEEQAPIVVVFDDLQWGEETFLDLVEANALLSTGAPLLLLCMARPELVERRPTWPAPLLLQPLAPTESEALIGDGADPDLRERIARAAGGNPLFITEMLAMGSERGEVEVPATLRALLAMRLDQLEPEERRVLECGAVEGEIFHRGAVQALAPEETQVTPRLAALVRRQLIRPDRAQLPGHDGYRFRHVLIRDAAYEALPKSVRADLHRRFAAWLGGHGRGLVEVDEVVGYHLEQASQYLAELGERDPTLGAEGAARLAAAGRLARWRGDRQAALSLFRRAVALSEHPDVHLVVDLSRELIDPREAAELLDRAAERAERNGSANDVAFARAMGAYFWEGAGKGSADEQERLGLTALPLLEAVGDHAGLAHLWFALANGVYAFRCQYAQMEDAAEQELRHARLAGQSPRPRISRSHSFSGLVRSPRVSQDSTC